MGPRAERYRSCAWRMCPDCDRITYFADVVRHGIGYFGALHRDGCPSAAPCAECRRDRGYHKMDCSRRSVSHPAERVRWQLGGHRPGWRAAVLDAQAPDLTVHVLRGGSAACGFADGKLPRDWPLGHRWMRTPMGATCVACVRACVATDAAAAGPLFSRCPACKRGLLQGCAPDCPVGLPAFVVTPEVEAYAAKYGIPPVQAHVELSAQAYRDKGIDEAREVFRRSAARLTRAYVGDVVQLRPEFSNFGPLLCIVDEVSHGAARCYALVPNEQVGQPPHQLYVRVGHEHYVVIGRAEWVDGGVSPGRQIRDTSDDDGGR